MLKYYRKHKINWEAAAVFNRLPLTNISKFYVVFSVGINTIET